MSTLHAETQGRVGEGFANRAGGTTIRVRGYALPWLSARRPPLVLRRVRRHGCQVWQVAAPAGVLLNIACDRLDPCLRVIADGQVYSDAALEAAWRDTSGGAELRAALCHLVDCLAEADSPPGFGPALSHRADTVGHTTATKVA